MSKNLKYNQKKNNHSDNHANKKIIKIKLVGYNITK